MTFEPKTPTTLDAFTRGYIECMMWCEMDGSDSSGGYPLDAKYTIADIAPDTMQLIIYNCKRFQTENADLLAEVDYGHPDFSNAAIAGHDFWLSRSGHGTGFQDRGLGTAGDRLAAASRRTGECSIYVSDHAQIHVV